MMINWFSLANNRSRLLSALFLFALLSLPGCKKKRDIDQLPYMAPFKNLGSDSFVLAFLSNIEGYVEPCGCTPDPLGGLARFSTVYGDVKAALNNRIALVDAGNLLFESTTRNDVDLCQDEKRIDLLLSTLTKLGLTTVFPGHFDNARGQVYRNLVYKKYRLKTLSTVGPSMASSTNVQIISVADYEIGIIGVALDDAKMVAALREELTNTVKTLISSKKIKAIVALCHMPLELTKLTFDSMDNIDVVIHGQPLMHTPKSPTRLGNNGPLLIEGGRQGQYFTVLTLTNLAKRTSAPIALDSRVFIRSERIELLTARLAALHKQAQNAPVDRIEFVKKRIALAKAELTKLQSSENLPPLLEPSISFIAIPLTKKIDPEPEVNKQLLDYEKSIPLLVKKCEEHLVCPKVDPKVASYVGANVCKACHAQAFEVYESAVFMGKTLDDSGREINRSIGHSKAWQTLVEANKDSDRSCIGCHSIGFMEPGGYCKASEVSFRKNVQCESCHGPGSLHAQSGDKQFIKRKVEEATCRGCHHVPHIQSHDSFNYEERLVKILGKGHGENLLKEITHKLKAVSN